MEDRFEISWDGATVWVNDDSGTCIGRFSKWGVDVHKTGDEQIETGNQCLDCIHDLPPAESWDRFVTSMGSFHGVHIPSEARPDFVSRHLAA